MPVDFKLKTPDTLGALMGGGKVTQGSAKTVFGKLHGMFKGHRTPERPKVVASKLNKGEVMLKRPDGRKMRLEGLLRANAPKSQPKAGGSVSSGVSGPVPKPTTLHEDLDNLTTAPRTKAGEIEKSLGEIDKLITKYKDTQDLGEQTDLADLKKLQSELKSALLHVQASTLKDGLLSVQKKMAPLLEGQKDLQTKQGKEASDARLGLITAQHVTFGQIDKSLGEISKLIKQYKDTQDPGEKADLEQLRGLRRDLTQQALLVEFPNLQTLAQEPLKLDKLDEAWNNFLPHDSSSTLMEDLNQFDEIVRVAKDLSSGKPQLVLFDDNKPADFGSLKEKLDNHIEELESGSQPSTQKGVEALETYISALKDLSENIGTRAHIEDTVDRLVLMQDPADAPKALAAKLGLDKGSPSLFDHLISVQKELASQKPVPLSFKVGACVRDLASGVPYLHDHGSSEDISKNRMAIESMGVLTSLIAEGEIPVMLLGTDAELDKAYLFLQQSWGERTAIEHLTAEHARDGKLVPNAQEIKDAAAKGRAAATSRFNLTVAERRLERLLKTDRRIWYKPSTWGDKGAVFGEGASSSVLKDKQFLDALKQLGGKDAGRDVAFVLANISALQQETLKAESEVLGLHQDSLAARARTYVGAETREVILSKQPYKGQLETLMQPHEQLSVEDQKPLLRRNEATVLAQYESDKLKELIANSPYKEIAAARGDKAALARYTLDQMKPEVDPNKPLAHIGISNKDIEAMGLTGEDQTELAKTVQRLHAQGLGNVDQVVETNEAINTVLERVLRSSLTQQNIVTLAQESAEGMGRALLHDFLIDAVVMEQRDMRSMQETLQKAKSFDDPNHADTAVLIRKVATNLDHFNKMKTDDLDRPALQKSLDEDIDKLNQRALTGQLADIREAIATLRKVPVTNATQLLDKDFGITVASESVGNIFSRMNKRAENMVTENGSKPEALTKLQTGSDQYVKFEKSIVDLMAERKSVDARYQQSKEILENASKDPPEGLGMDLDPNKPGGLRSARLVQQALDYQNTIETMPRNSDKVKEAILGLTATLDQLKGFDLTRGRRPWHQKIAAAFGGGERPDIAELRKLDKVTKAIIYVREEADTLKSNLDKDIADAGEKMDVILQRRREENPEVMEFARQLVRTAVLASWPGGGKDFGMKAADGRVLEGYDPAAKRADIEKLLKGWGFDTQKYAPEIDEVLYGTLSAEDMAKWRAEARFSEDGKRLMLAKGPSPKPWDHPIDFMTDRRDMDEATRRAFLAELESFQEGDKLNLKSGMRFTADTNRVSPTGGIGYIRARLAGSVLGQFEIERGSDGFKLHLRAGFDIKGNVDGGIYIGYGEAEDGHITPTASLDVSGGVEGSGSRLTGATFSFAPDKVADLVEFVDKMLKNDELTTKDWAKAKDVAQTVEKTLKGAVNGRAGLKGKLMFSQEEGLGITGEISAAVGVGWKGQQWTSHNERTLKGEVEYNAKAEVNVGLYAQLYKFKEATGSDKDSPQIGGNVSPDIAGVGAAVMGAYTRKWKHVLNPDGQYTKGEIVRQSNVRTAASLGLLATKALDDKLEKDDKFKANFKALMDVAGPEDVIAVTYATKPEIIERVNILLTRARKLHNEGQVDEADRLAARAESLLEDDANYIPAKVSLITTNTSKVDVSNMNLMFFKWENYTDGKQEHPSLVLDVPK